MYLFHLGIKEVSQACYVIVLFICYHTVSK